MASEDPLASSYTISRINPAFRDESFGSFGDVGVLGDPNSSGYASRSSSTLSQHERKWERCDDKDGVRQLCEGVSRSATLQAVCRALEVGVNIDHSSACLRYPSAWSEYLGSGIVPGDITLKAKGYEQVLDMTLDSDGTDRLVALVEHGSRQRCCCRAVTALLALTVFLAAIVAASVVVTRGRRVFGAL